MEKFMNIFFVLVLVVNTYVLYMFYNWLSDIQWWETNKEILKEAIREVSIEEFWNKENYEFVKREQANQITQIREFSNENPNEAESNTDSSIEEENNIQTLDDDWFNTLSGFKEKRPYYEWTQNSNIVLYEFSDYDCPACKMNHQSWGLENTDYSKVYMNFPLEEIHPHAFGKALIDEYIWDNYPDIYLDIRNFLFEDNWSDLETLLVSIKDEFDIEIDEEFLKSNYELEIQNSYFIWWPIWIRATPSTVIVNEDTKEYIIYAWVVQEEIIDNYVELLTK